MRLPRTLLFVLATLIAPLAITSCGDSTATTPTSQTALVTLQVDFPQAIQPTGLKTLASPATATKATISIIDGDQPVRTIDVTSPASGTTATQVVSLVVGKAYRFETSVKDAANNELAWGTDQATITSDTALKLTVASILSGINITTSAAPQGGTSAALTVVGKGTPAPLVPYSDYEAQYDVAGATIQSSSKLGALLQFNGQDTATLTVTVKGMLASHMLGVLKQTFQVANVISPGMVTVTGTITNWLLNKNLTATLRGTSLIGPSGLTGSVDPSGQFKAFLPDISNASTGGLVQRQSVWTG